MIWTYMLMMWSLLIGFLLINALKVCLGVRALILFHLLKLLLDSFDRLRFLGLGTGMLSCVVAISRLTWESLILLWLLSHLELVDVFFRWVACKDVDNICLLWLNIEGLLYLHVWSGLGKSSKILDVLDILPGQARLDLKVLLNLSDWLWLKMTFFGLILLFLCLRNLILGQPWDSWWINYHFFDTFYSLLLLLWDTNLINAQCWGKWYLLFNEIKTRWLNSLLDCISLCLWLFIFFIFVRSLLTNFDRYLWLMRLIWFNAIFNNFLILLISLINFTSGIRATDPWKV